MLKKLYQKDGIITIFNEQLTNQDIKLYYHIINNKDKDKDKDRNNIKKDYYILKGITYQD